MSYYVKAQSFDNPAVYVTYETADYTSWMEFIVSIAQTRRRGFKMRLMEVDDNAVRFDVQRTGATE